MNASFKTLICTTAIFAAFSIQAAPVDLTGSVSTSVANLGGDTRRIRQTLDVTLPNDPETNVDGIEFNFDKAADAAGGIYSGSSLDSVKVTIRYEVEDINLTITNNRATSYTGSAGEQGNVVNNWNTFTTGARTFQNNDDSFGIESFFFAGNLLSQSTAGVPIAAGDTLEAGPVDYTNTESRNVHPDYFVDYSGTGSFLSAFNTDILTSNNFTGGDIAASQNVGDINFFMEVEYIVIPEPGTLALAGISLIGIAGGAFLRRRRRG